MTHMNVYDVFKHLFPEFKEHTTEWHPNGKNSIRIRFGHYRPDMVFTYQSPKDWKFETVDSFLNTMQRRN